MHNKIVLAIGALLLTALAHPNQAVAQGAMWTGYYAGVQAGGGWGNNSTDISCSDNVFGGAFCTVPVANGVFPNSLSSNLDGFIGGGQVGYNQRFGVWVVGAEADLSWSSAKGSQSVQTAVPGFEPSVTNASEDLNWLSTVRARLGFVAGGNLLLYATGGLAFGGVRYNYSAISLTSGDFIGASESETQVGWTVGAGAELALNRSWSIRTEYLFYDLGDQTLTAQGIDNVLGPINAFHYPQFETKGHIVRAGANFFIN